ncbi:MAG: TIGR03546 family protein [Elusimicrobiota bacterium]
MNPLSLLKSIVAALQGEDDPAYAAAGFALGAAWGLVPKDNLCSVLFVLAFFFLRIDKGMALASAALFTPLGFLLDGPAHSLGGALLSCGALHPLWTWLYNLPVLPLTRFNNTVVLGNLAIGALLFVPLFVLSKRGILRYRAAWRARAAQWRVVKALSGLRIVSLYLEWTRGGS